MSAVRNRPIADVLQLRANPLSLFIEALREPAEMVRYQFGPYRAVLAKRAEHVEHVLVKNHDNYLKGQNYEPLKLTLGEGLVTSEGELWKRQRKLLQPAFHHRSLAMFADVMSRATEALVDEWEADPTETDLHRAMMQLTFRIVCLTLFSADVQTDGDFGDALHDLLDWTNRRSETLIRPPLWMPTPGNVRFKRSRRRFDDLIYALIRERRESGEPKGDLLDMLLAACDDGMPEHLVRDELITLALAGHETTANALSWTFYLLSKHPDVARRVVEEVDAVLGDRQPTLEDLKDGLDYTGRVIEESMRLFPPVWGFERQAIAEDRLGNERVPPKTSVMIVPYSMHRDWRYWDNPEGFDPDRFLPEAKKDRPRFAYLPFGGGPRVCIGNAFAMMEAKIIVALVLRRIRLELEPGFVAELEPSITLRPKNGIHVRIDRRFAKQAP